MKTSAMAVALAAFGLAALAIVPARAVTAADDSPYRTISVRNIFDLQDPPPPPKQTPPPKPTPNVKLIGTMKMGSDPEAVIWSQAPGNPPAQPVTSVMFAGQRVGGIELLEIDLAGKSAKVKIDDEEIRSLKLEDKPTTGAGAQIAINGRPALPTAGMPQPTYNPSASRVAARPGAPASFSAPAIPNVPTAPSISAGGATLNPGLPSRPVRTDTSSQTTLSPEEQMIMMEAQRDAALKAGSPIANLIPPTPLGNLLNQVPGGNNTTAPPAPPMPGGGTTRR